MIADSQHFQNIFFVNIFSITTQLHPSVKWNT